MLPDGGSVLDGCSRRPRLEDRHQRSGDGRHARREEHAAAVAVWANALERRHLEAEKRKVGAGILGEGANYNYRDAISY